MHAGYDQVKNLLSHHFGQTKQKYGWILKKTTTTNKKKQEKTKIEKNKNKLTFHHLNNIQYVCVHPFRVQNKGPSYYIHDIYSWIKICYEIDFYLLFSERNKL